MDIADIVIMLDKKYANEPIPCPNEGREVMLPQSQYKSSKHGALTVGKGGAKLICGRCGYEQYVARP